jgi:hypothetical protein
MGTSLLTPEAFYHAGGPAPKTQANWRVMGIGPKFIKVGRLVRYHPDDVAAWINTRRVQSTSEATA